MGAGASKSAIARKKGEECKASTTKLRELGCSIAADMKRNGTDPEKTLVITHLGAKDGLRKHLPAGIAFLHFGNIRGLDNYGDFSALYLIGEHLLPADVCESWCESVYNQPVIGKSVKVTKVLATRDGKRYGVDVWHRDHELTGQRMDDLRSAEMVQAVGRLRGVNRTKDNKCRVVIVADVVLPIEVDAVEEWASWSTDPIELMEAYGVVAETANGAAVLYGFVGSKRFWGERFDRDIFSGTLKVRPYISNSLEGGTFSVPQKVARIRVGSGNRSLAVKYNPEIVGNDLGAYLSVVMNIKAVIVSERSDKFKQMMGTYGFIPKSKKHCHKLDKTIFPKVDSAKRGLANVEAEASEIEITYKLAGRGQSATTAIVQATNAADAQDVVSKSLPEATFSF